MADVRISCYGIGTNWEALEGCMEISDTILCQEPDQI